MMLLRGQEVLLTNACTFQPRRRVCGRHRTPRQRQHPEPHTHLPLCRASPISWPSCSARGKITDYLVACGQISTDGTGHSAVVSRQRSASWRPGCGTSIPQEYVPSSIRDILLTSSSPAPRRDACARAVAAAYANCTHKCVPGCQPKVVSTDTSACHYADGCAPAGQRDRRDHADSTAKDILFSSSCQGTASPTDCSSGRSRGRRVLRSRRNGEAVPQLSTQASTRRTHEIKNDPLTRTFHTNDNILDGLRSADQFILLTRSLMKWSRLPKSPPCK